VRIEREDASDGHHDVIEINDYGVLEELLDDLSDMMQKRMWMG
jgi:hypothetical protein